MKILDILREYDEAKTLDVFRNKLMTRLKTEQYHIISSVENEDERALRFMRLVKMSDPTPNQEFSRWIVQTYSNAGIDTVEDFIKVRAALTKYADQKKRRVLSSEFNDINRIKSLADLEDVVDKFSEAKSGKEEKRELSAELFKSGDAELVFDSPKYKVISPKTQEASCYFGQGTKWCTAAREDNAFEGYHSRGPLYIIQFKNQDKKWELHFEDEEFMDAKNDPLRSHELAQLFPEIFDWTSDEQRSHLNLPAILRDVSPGTLTDKQTVDLLSHDFKLGRIAHPTPQNIIDSIERALSDINKTTRVITEGDWSAVYVPTKNVPDILQKTVLYGMRQPSDVVMVAHHRTSMAAVALLNNMVVFSMGYDDEKTIDPKTKIPDDVLRLFSDIFRARDDELSTRLDFETPPRGRHIQQLTPLMRSETLLAALEQTPQYIMFVVDSQVTPDTVQTLRDVAFDEPEYALESRSSKVRRMTEPD